MSKRAPLWIFAATLTGVVLLGVTWVALHAAATAARVLPAGAPVSPGAVVINEVAWMGTAASYDDEWIELYNTTAAPITLIDWALIADDGSPSILLDGVIPARGYFLLERIDDAVVSDLLADQIYNGALANDPAEGLSLFDDRGTLIDRVDAGGAGWPAGNNATKQTMERKDPWAPGTEDNWADNDGMTRNGHDANGDPLNGTPNAHNSATVGPPSRAADLAVAKTGPVTACAGCLVTYTLGVSNTGSLTATAVRLTDALPAAITFLTQTSGLPFSQRDNWLAWTIGDLYPDTPALRITVTGRVSVTAPGVVRNVITATTPASETFRTNNHATWETHIAGAGKEAGVLIAALLYEGYQTNDPDEALQLVNLGNDPADLSGWKICDAAGGGTCATIFSGTLAPDEAVWLAHWASAFYTSSGHYPAYAVKGLTPGIAALSGSWPGFANHGDEAVLYDADDKVVDTLVYEDGDVFTPGWRGVAVEPWQVGNEGAKGYILYRKLDETSGHPTSDTDTAADWAQDAADPLQGRRARYPGWDLETFFYPLTATESARVTVGVAPDNAAEVVLAAIDAAQRQVEIGVYSLRHPTVIERLVDRASQGVTVTLLLEGDPVGLSKTDPRWYQQMWACQRLHETGHGSCWFMINDTDARIFDRYSFMHAKYMLIDRQQVLITSQNLTARGMPDDDRSNGTHGSRGVVLLTDAPSVVARVAQVFDHDLDPAHHVDLLEWSPVGADYGPPPATFAPVLTVTDAMTYAIVFSRPLTVEGVLGFELFTAPEAALRQRDGLLGLLARAGQGDRVDVEGLDERAHWGQDPLNDPSPRLEAYIDAARRGARVRILLNSGWFDADFYDEAQNRATADYANSMARQEHLDLIATTGDPTCYGIHNKMVLVWLDGQGGYAHLGSLNGGEMAHKTNRELAIQVHSDEVYAYLKRVFDWDWNISRPVYLPLIFSTWSPPEPPVDYPVISEVLYDPLGAGESDEWVEIYNPTEVGMDLSGWHLGDVGPGGEYGSGLYTFPPGTLLPAGGVLLIARQAEDVTGFTPDLEFLVDPLRDAPDVANMLPAGSWEGFGFALGNAGDQVMLLDATTAPVDVLVYGSAGYSGVVPHPGVGAPGHSLERRPAIYDSDDCSQDFFERYPPDPGAVSRR